MSKQTFAWLSLNENINAILSRMWWIQVACAVVALGYFALVRSYKYWINRGVPQKSPLSEALASWGVFFRTKSFFETVQINYNEYPNARYAGFYQFLSPTLQLRDLELIKEITVKEFKHFVDHQLFAPEDVDPLWSNNLFILRGHKWLEMRTILSPAFTSSKMKYMFSLMSQNGKQFVQHFLQKNENVITLEMQDTSMRFVNDVVASTAFGIECDSLKDPNNEFYMMGKQATDFGTLRKTIAFLGYAIMPKVCAFFKVMFIGKKESDFFRAVTETNIESRQKLGISRPDMIHLLLEARKHGSKRDVQLTDDQITSQSLSFFFAGFDSVASLMCFISYELATNPDIQERLIQEVDEAAEACGGNITYETLQGMKYLDMVVSEGLRKWPSSVVSDRVCTKPFTIQPKTPEEKPLLVEKNITVWIPVLGIHRDPKYWPEPDRFDPERFSDENKEKIVPFSYIPFGSGPRNCIGAKFALLETKVLFFYILSHFEIVPVEKTQIPLQISRKTLNVTAEGGFWFGLKRRSST